jgi:amiloride-sensitive sodium channel
MTTLQVPFPAITICHPQSVIDYKIFGYSGNLTLPPGSTRKVVWDALPLLGVFTEHRWTMPSKKDVKLVHETLQLNNLTVEDAINALGMTCEDFILVCQWAGKRFPCFQSHYFLSWTPSKSHFGACCSFNYHIDPKFNDSVVAANTYGIHGGLSVIGTGAPQASDGKSGAIYSEGFVLMVHHPNDFAVEAHPMVLVKLNRETFVSVYPTDIRTSEQALQLPQRQRHCATDNDFKPPKNYRNPACMLECLTDTVHEKCGCHPFHLPRKSIIRPTIRDCTILDALCFTENYCECGLWGHFFGHF